MGIIYGAILGGAAPSIGVGGGGGLCGGQTVTIGALNDLSGDLSTQGKGDLAAEQLGIQDVNSYLQTSGCKLTFALNANDYKLDTPTALTQLQAMQAAGIQVVIGPLNSGTAAGILSFANSNHVVLLSPSSTSPALAIPNDYLFRTAPNDAAQGQADARILLDRGASAVILINRDDTYGNGLANATKTFLLNDNKNVIIKGPYKYDTATTDFSALITQIGSDWTTLSGQVGASKVAIFAVSFQEIGTLLLQAQKSNPALLSTPLPWFGTDGTAQNSLLTNSTTGPVVSQVRLPSTLFGLLTNNTKSLAFYNRIKGTSAGAAILGGGAFYTFEGYDDVWLAALSIISAGKNDGTAIHNVLPSVAANFYGLTGPEALQPSGDRALFPGSGYQIWKVVKSGSAYSWVLAGSWDYNTDSVTWISPP
ncbi:MAG: ABC transporter substrate-binding protein [Nitrososphaerales archaeon]|nr:ABC transporter substrate-binding protein [Nitrososphaerales archaeon]